MFSVVHQSSEHFSDMTLLECTELSARSGVEDRNLGLEHNGYFLRGLVLNLQRKLPDCHWNTLCTEAGCVCKGQIQSLKLNSVKFKPLSFFAVQAHQHDMRVSVC